MNLNQAKYLEFFLFSNLSKLHVHQLNKQVTLQIFVIYVGISKMGNYPYSQTNISHYGCYIRNCAWTAVLTDPLQLSVVLSNFLGNPLINWVKLFLLIQLAVSLLKTLFETYRIPWQLRVQSLSLVLLKSHIFWFSERNGQATQSNGEILTDMSYLP